MRIGIDGTPIGRPFHDGIRHYAEQLLIGLARLDSFNEYIIFTTKTDVFLPYKNFKIVTIPQNIPILKRQLFLPLAAKKEHLDVFHYLEPFGAYFFHHPRIISTIHDINLDVVYSEAYNTKYLINKYYSRILLTKTLQRTHTFIAVSEFTKRELLEIRDQQVGRSSIVVVLEAPHPAFHVIQKDRHKGQGHFLCMGDFSPRKNIPRVIEAYTMLPQSTKQRCRLKIIISTDIPKKNFMRKIKEHNVAPYVDMLQNVSLAQLVRLYNNAFAFIYPSLYEGFGIPILEAMACGCPVVTSDCGAMKEVAGEAALHVNPEDTQDILRSMHVVLENKKVASALRQAGVKRAKRFSWERTAQQTLAVYERIFRSA